MRSRRAFLWKAAAAAAAPMLLPPERLVWAGQSAGLAQQGQGRFEPWTPGTLDIHQISTGRGNSALLILPDGTTLMVDAGAIYGPDEYIIAPKPDGSRRPGEWIGRYVQRHLRAAGLEHIDTFLNTHLHADHLGAVGAMTPMSADGRYRLTGVSDVAALVPIRRYIDRGWPDYNFPAPLREEFQVNYENFLKAQAERGAKVERFRTGANDQIRMERNAAGVSDFEIRNLAGNGEIWTGEGSATRRLNPELATLKPSEYPVENSLSLAIRMRYGRFGFYTGGDLNADTNFGRDPWRDIEGPMSRVCGPVSVAVSNHHGHFNATSFAFVQNLRPRVFIIPTWDSAHPAASAVNAMLSTLYSGPRDIFATAMRPENRVAVRRISEFRSSNGHVVVRVAKGGESFRVVVLDNADESDRVTGSFGPYASA